MSRLPAFLPVDGMVEEGASKRGFYEIMLRSPPLAPSVRTATRSDVYIGEAYYRRHEYHWKPQSGGVHRAYVQQARSDRAV